MKLTQLLLTAVLAMALGISASAQDIYLDASTHGKTIYTDGATFYDSGRIAGRYSNFEDHSTTICSNSGAPVMIEFFEFFLEDGKDFLYVSLGEGDEMRPMEGSPFTGESLKKKMITSSESCMTFRMVSDFNVMRSGWDAEISVLEPVVQVGKY